MLQIDIDYWLKDKEGKIVSIQHLKLFEDDIIDMLKLRYDNDELSVPMRLNKDDITPQFTIDSIHI